MKRQGLWGWFLMLSFACLVMGCSGSSDSGETATGSESVYDPGAAVSAVGYADAYGIEVFAVSGDGELSALHDGDYVEPGTRTLGIKIQGDPARIDRVLLSDGGLYQVQAVLQGDIYVAAFEIGEENLYESILVQVVHNNGLASKDKVILRTARHHIDGQYIKNSVGLLVSQGLIDEQRHALAEILDRVLKDVFARASTQSPGFIRSLSYGDGNPDTVDVEIETLAPVSTQQYPLAVLWLSLIVKDVDLSALPLYGQDLVSTFDNDLSIGCFLSIDDRGTNGSIGFVLDFSDPVQVRFDQEFFMKDVVVSLLRDHITGIDLPPFGRELSGLCDGFDTFPPEYLRVYGVPLDVDDLSGGLDPDLSRYLFADIYGIPEHTGTEALSVGMGLHIADCDDVIWEAHDMPAQNDPLDMERVFEEVCAHMAEQAFDRIRQEYGELITELSYGDGDSGTPDIVVNSFVLEDTADVNIKTVRLGYTIKSVDLSAVSLFGCDLISTQDNDLIIESDQSLEYRVSGDDDVLIITITGVSDVRFVKNFIGREYVEDKVRTDLESMDAVWFYLKNIMQQVDLDLDVTASLFAGCEVPLFPDVSPCITEPSWDLILPEAYDVAAAVSQNTINWFMETVLSRDIEWDVNELLASLLGEDFEGFNQGGAAGEETVLRMSVPPLMDVRGSHIRVSFNDVILQYRIDEEPQWEASIDLDLIVEVQTENGRLDFYLTQNPQNTHFHIMRDNPGNLGIFDHSTLVSDVFEKLPGILGQSPDDPPVSLDLEAFAPSVVFEDVPSPVTVSAGGGWLYIDMAVSGLDLHGVSLWEKRCE